MKKIIYVIILSLILTACSNTSKVQKVSNSPVDRVKTGNNQDINKKEDNKKPKLKNINTGNKLNQESFDKDVDNLFNEVR